MFFEDQTIKDQTIEDIKKTKKPIPIIVDYDAIPISILPNTDSENLTHKGDAKN